MKFKHVVLLWLCLPIFAWASCDVADKIMPVYGKTVLVTGFPFLKAEQARWGAIQGMEVRLSQLIADQLNERSTHIALDLSYTQIRDNSFNHHPYGTALYSNHTAKWGTVDLPESQFILTGMIENVAATQSEFLPFMTRNMRRVMGLMDKRYNQPRRLAILITLINRYTGETIWRHRYVNQENWNLKARDKITLDNPSFWQSPYGQQLIITLDQLIQDVENALDCESYMNKVAEVAGKNIFIKADNKSNIKLGDYFNMAKLSEQGPYLPIAASRLSNIFARAKVISITPFGIQAQLLPKDRGKVKIGDLVTINQG